MANKLERLAAKLPPLVNPQEGLAAGRLAIKADVTLVALLDDVTTPTVQHFNSSNVAVASQPVQASATPDERLGDVANYVKFTAQTDPNEYVKISLASAVNLSKYNYLALWVSSDTAIAADDYEIELLKDGVALNNGTKGLPAITTADIWGWLEVKIDDINRESVDEIRIRNTTNDNDVVSFQYLIAYDYSNGGGPVNGVCEVHENIGSTALVRGDLANKPVGRQTGVAEAADNDTDVIGPIVIGGAVGDNVLVQTSGDIYVVTGTGGSTAGLQAVPTGPQTADDDSTAFGAGFGVWKETIAAGGHARLRLGTPTEHA